MSVRNECCPTDPVPDDFFYLQIHRPSIITCHGLLLKLESQMVTTILLLLFINSCVLFYSTWRAKIQDAQIFLDKKDSHFRQLHETLDSYFHKLHSDGVGKQIKHAEVISSEEEDQLWEKEWWTLQHLQGYKMLSSLLLGKGFVYVKVKSTDNYSCHSWNALKTSMSTMKMFQRIQMVVSNSSMWRTR